ncbi:DNA-directed RNA polymerase II core subunit [Linderina macrospora]|uniref:DNA-directed RNA polymerase II core subunit n=1 Tax=Linderina macrospora TaxID=4868 RepID=A0ACC1JB89_9FUNG|nr:DNA-directed RNA polymerase II core subunit [Linderina macrospora]
MNAPERFEMFVLPEGAKKIDIIKDSKMPNCIQFNIQKEDHTIANILRYKLLKNPHVIFAAYRLPHPLEYYVEIKVQTTSEVTPISVVKEAIQSLVREYGNIRSKFENELYRVDAPGTDSGRTNAVAATAVPMSVAAGAGVAGAGGAYRGFGAMDTSASEFGAPNPMGSGAPSGNERNDDVDIDF